METGADRFCGWGEVDEHGSVYILYLYILYMYIYIYVCVCTYVSQQNGTVWNWELTFEFVGGMEVNYIRSTFCSKHLASSTEIIVIFGFPSPTFPTFPGRLRAKPKWKFP